MRLLDKRAKWPAMMNGISPRLVRFQEFVRYLTRNYGGGPQLTAGSVDEIVRERGPDEARFRHNLNGESSRCAVCLPTRRDESHRSRTLTDYSSAGT